MSGPSEFPVLAWSQRVGGEEFEIEIGPDEHPDVEEEEQCEL